MRADCRDRLRSHFGARGQVFMDVDTIQPGEDFIEKIKQTVASCDVLGVRPRNGQNCTLRGGSVWVAELDRKTNAVMFAAAFGQSGPGPPE